MTKPPFHWKKQRLESDLERHLLFDSTGTLQGHVQSTQGGSWLANAGSPSEEIGLFDTLAEAQTAIIYCLVGTMLDKPSGQYTPWQHPTLPSETKKEEQSKTKDQALRALKAASNASKRVGKWATPSEIAAHGRTLGTLKTAVALTAHPRAINTDDLEVLVQAGVAQSKIVTKRRSPEQAHTTKQLMYRPQ